MSTLNEGWAKPFEARKFHHFKDGSMKSDCSRYTYLSPREEMSSLDKRCCATCADKVNLPAKKAHQDAVIKAWDDKLASSRNEGQK